jgi:hypothetical protein
MCELTNLESEWCSHCTGAVEDVFDEVWELHDYVDVFSKQDVFDERRPGAHAHNPLPEVDASQVEMSDIYGRHEAVRLQKRRR